MIDGVGAAHRRADCALNYMAAIVLTGLLVWTKFDQHTVNLPADFAFSNLPAEFSFSIPPTVTVTPRAAAFDPGRSFAEMDQSECLAEVLYYEARGEGTEGEKAVAEVVLQRTRDAYYPHTICGVVYEGVQPDRKDCQFSFACDGALHKPKERGAWRNVRILADKILSGAVKLAGETGQAIAYHSVDVDPAWAQDMVETAQIGNHIFYRRDQSRMTSTAESDSGRQADNAPQKIDGVTDGSTEVHSEVQTADAVGQGA